jgi:hypothetical protein
MVLLVSMILWKTIGCSTLFARLHGDEKSDAATKSKRRPTTSPLL